MKCETLFVSIVKMFYWRWRRVAQWASALVFGSGEHRFKPHCSQHVVVSLWRSELEHRFKPHCSQHVVVSLRPFTPKCS